jgi:hypothetical protein
MKSRYPIAILFIVVIFIVLFVWIALAPPGIPGNSLDFQAIGLNSNLVQDIRQSKTNAFISVSVTNLSRNIIVYDRREIGMALLRNGVWETNGLGYSFPEQIYVGPGLGEILYSYNPIPPDTSAIMIGIPYTSLTWRGRLAYKISQSSIWRPVADLLWARDEANRSKTEWSPVFYLNVVTNKAPNHFPHPADSP